MSGRSDLSPRSTALLNSLAAAGHEVTVAQVTTSRLGRPRLKATHTWTTSGPRPPPRARLRPQILYPSNSKTVDVADDLAGSLDAWVARRPDWPWPNRDLIDAAPARPELSVPAGKKPPEKEPWAQHAGPTPAGRHTGRRVVLCYRPTPATPARYLGAALMRAGVDVVATDRVDFDDIGPADAVVIVESPSPPIELRGENQGIPVIYWAHHGEHHLEANIRLVNRYGTDLVLLAHSWHLAARFDRRVERFPFGAEVGAGEGTKPFAEREWDLAFVGSTEGTAYSRRRLLLDQARQGLDRVTIESGVPPSRVPALYGDARSVLNDGGTRHLPIPMRVFETAGAGALLVTGPAPGLDLILGEDYVPSANRASMPWRFGARLQMAPERPWPETAEDGPWRPTPTTTGSIFCCVWCPKWSTPISPIRRPPSRWHVSYSITPTVSASSIPPEGSMRPIERCGRRATSAGIPVSRPSIPSCSIRTSPPPIPRRRAGSLSASASTRSCWACRSGRLTTSATWSSSMWAAPGTTSTRSAPEAGKHGRSRLGRRPPKLTRACGSRPRRTTTARS